MDDIINAKSSFNNFSILNSIKKRSVNAFNISDDENFINIRKNYVLNKEICIFDIISSVFISVFEKKLCNYFELDKINLSFKKSEIVFYSDFYLKNYNFLQFDFSRIFSYFDCSFINFSPEFLTIILDLLFGGDGYYPFDKIEKRRFTSNEIRIIKKIYELAIQSYCIACNKHFKLNYKAISLKNDFIKKKEQVHSNNTKLIVSIFEIKINNIRLSFNIGILLSKIDEIKHAIVKNKNLNILKNQDKNKNSFVKNCNDIKINIKVKFKDFFLPVSEVNELKVGDILSIEDPEIVKGYSFGKFLLSGKYGLSKGKHAIFIKKINN
ncbi:MAG: FliM/FliN family flagellar motor switch protein [Buchnera aphidicola (Tetraneura sorini)]